MKRRAFTVLVAIAAALSISMFASSGPITGGGGLTRVYHSGAFYGLGTPGTTLDLRHDCSSGSGLAWDGSAWACSSSAGLTAAAGGMIHIGSGTVGLDGSGCGSGNVPTWSGSAWACGASGGGGSGGGYGSSLGSGSLTVTTATTTSTTNLSTLGTIDWLSSNAVGFTQSRTSLTCNVSSGACWEKITGGSLLAESGVDWIGSGSTGFTGTASITYTSTGSDTVTLTGMSSTNVSGYPTNVGAGLRFMLPSPGGNIQRVARIYLYQFSDTVVCNAHAQDASVADGSASTNASSGTDLQTTYTVTYKTNTASFVVLTCVETVNNGSTPNIAWAGVSLGAV